MKYNIRDIRTALINKIAENNPDFIYFPFRFIEPLSSFANRAGVLSESARARFFVEIVLDRRIRMMRYKIE